MLMTFSIPRINLSFLFLPLLGFILFGQTIATKPMIEVGGAILGLIALYTIGQDKKISPLPRGLVIICVTLFLFISLSCFYGIAASDAAHQLPRWAIVFPLCLAMIPFAMTTPLPSVRIWIALTISFALACLYLISSDLTNYVLQFKLKGPGFEPSDFNKPIGVLTMFTPALLAPLLISQNYKYKIYAAALFIILGALVIPSFAQSALLSFLVIILCFLMPLKSKFFWKLVRVVTIVGILGLPFIMTPAYDHYADTLKKAGVMRQAASAERLEIWSAISERVEEKPIIGWGYNAARVLEMPIARVYFFDPIVAHPHNLVLQIWLESGLIGALLACIAFTKLWRQIEHEPNPQIRRLYFTSVAATVSFALVGWNMWQTWWVITLFFVGIITIISARIIAQGGLKNSK